MDFETCFTNTHNVNKSHFSQRERNGAMFPKWGPKILGWKRNNFISIHQTSPTTKRQQIQIIATADFLIFCFHSMSFISNSKQVFERKNINKNESNRL